MADIHHGEEAMSPASAPSPDDAIRALAAEVTQRIRGGEKPAIVRSELLTGGLETEIVDYILAEASLQPKSQGRTTFAIILSGVLVLVCAIAGFGGGLWVATLIPPSPGLAAIATCLLAVIAVILSTALGVGVGLGITVLLASWTDRETQLDVWE